jgi:hypothetical protein
MQTKNCHCSEHISFPAHKMIEKGILNRVAHVYQGGGVCLSGKVGNLTPLQRKLLKKDHRKRSRRFLKDELRDL